MTEGLAPKALFDEAIALIHAGDPSAAETKCRRALQSFPRDVNMRALLGALLIKLNRTEEAESTLRAAIAQAPTFGKPHEDLGYLLVQQNRPADAIPVLERAARLDPKLEKAWFTLGKAFAMLGRGAEADRAFEQSFALSPERRLMAHAAEHQKEGRLEEAEHAYRRILRHNPKNVDALRLLALISKQAGRDGEAEALLKKALSLAPDYLAAVLDLGHLYKDQDRFEDALRFLDRAIALDPAQLQAHHSRGAVLAATGFSEEAVAAYQRCLTQRPSHLGALLGIGHVFKAIGRYQDAVSAYQSCIRYLPSLGEAYWSLANLKTYHFDEAAITEMERRVAEREDAASPASEASTEAGDARGVGFTTKSSVNLRFALAKAYEDRGDFERAWQHYRAGNVTQRGEVSYDPVQTEAMNDRLVEVFTKELVGSRQGGGDPDPAPIFIVGLPRSGSTLLEQILASHSQVEGTSELPYVGRLTVKLNHHHADFRYPEVLRELTPRDFAGLGQAYLAQARMHRRTGAPRFVDKMPNNFPNVGLIALMLPNAKVIDARRHPLDACLSCYRQLFAKGQSFTFDLLEIGEYYLQYQRMMDHWAQVLPGRVLTVQYEEVVADLEAQSRRMIEFCELPWEDSCLRFHESKRAVRTPSAEQVRQPIYDRSIGQWRRYERHLDELIAVLEPIRDRYRALEKR